MITIYWERNEATQAPEGGDVMATTIGTLELDVLSSEELEVTATLTEHPVDDGSVIADHVIHASRGYTLEVGHSASPVHLREDGAEMTEQDGATTIHLDDGTDRMGSALEILTRLCDDGAEVDIEGLSLDVEGWVITGVNSSRVTETAGALIASIVVRQVRKATLQEIDRPAPRVERARRTQDRGQQGAQDTGSTEAAPRNQSAAASVLDRATALYTGQGAAP